MLATNSESAAAPLHLLRRTDAVIKISSWFYLADQSEAPTLIQAIGRAKLRRVTQILSQGKYKACMSSFGPEHRSLDWHSFTWLAAESCALGENLGRKHDPRHSREAVRLSKWCCRASPHGPKVTTTKISSSTGAVTCSNLRGLGRGNTDCRRKELENVPGTQLAFMALNCCRTGLGKVHRIIE